MNKKILFSFFLLSVGSVKLFAQYLNNPESNHGNKFEQLGSMLRDPNMYRSASGIPGPNYWQQKPIT